LPESWRDHMRKYKDRWIVGLSVVLSLLVHVGVIVFFLYGGFVFQGGGEPQTIDFDLSQLDAEALSRMTPEDDPERLHFERFQGNQRIPQRADAYGFQDHDAGRATHRADRPIEEIQNRPGPRGPGQGMQRPGGRRLPKIPKVGEGVGVESEHGAGGHSDPVAPGKPRSVDQMISRAGLPANPGGGGDGAVNAYNPNVGEAGDTLSISTREYKYMAYFAHMKEKIEMAWVYPQAAQQMGQQGMVTLRFTVMKSGQVHNVSVIRTSGYQLLDRYAMKAVKEAHFNPMPAHWPDKQLTISANFIYYLIGARSVQ